MQINKVVLCSCLKDNWFMLSFILSLGRRKSLGEINEESLININVRICLWRINIGTFCFKCSVSLCFISIYVVKVPFLPLREPHLVPAHSRMQRSVACQDCHA